DDRRLQAYTQLRQTALQRLDAIRDLVEARLREEQQLFARLKSDQAVVTAAVAMLSGLDRHPEDLPAPDALKPPTITEQSRVFAGDDVMSELQLVWRWWHEYAGSLETPDRARAVAIDHLIPQNNHLGELIADRISAQIPRFDSGRELVEKLD